MSLAPPMNLRARKKAQTRRAIQEAALRLFLDKGYEATTVQEIANAAGVSHMTFFRYFPTKEDVVLADEYDPMLAEHIAARPAGEPALASLQHAVREGLSRIYAGDRATVLARSKLVLANPPLRARLWVYQAATERLISQALAERNGVDPGELRLRVLAAAGLAAMNTAILVWVERDGELPLPDLIDRAFDLLRAELG
jgi:AcrR family transcriptional regulator